MLPNPQYRKCHDWLATYMEFTNTHEAPEVYHLWTALSVVGAAAKRNMSFDRTFYTVFPNLYVIIVGPTGDRKSSAAKVGVKILRKAVKDTMTIISDRATPEGLINAMNVKKIDPDDPQAVISDSCIYIFASELGVFLGRSKYLGDMIPILTNLYEGTDFSDYVTKSKGTFKIENGILSFLGCSTPDWIPRCMPEDSAGGGFASRFIFVSGGGGKKIAWVERTPKMVMLEAALVHDLQKISELKGQFGVTADAHDWFESWYKTGTPVVMDPKLAGYYSRKHDFIFKLAMISSICRNEQFIIDVHNLEQAKATLESAEPFMLRAYANLGVTEQANVGMKILFFLQRNGGRAKWSEILRHVWKYIRNADELKTIMASFEQQGYVQCQAAGNATIWSLLVDPNSI